MEFVSPSRDLCRVIISAIVHVKLKKCLVSTAPETTHLHTVFKYDLITKLDGMCDSLEKILHTIERNGVSWMGSERVIQCINELIRMTV